ncbi:MAG: adenosine deaminase family protein [Deltaproteobacteria bacterium]|nr:MAG: adenosine deaminase family protein [Deltaproteobacteria bacterium]
MSTHFPREFLERIPKTDLHVHLDGSLRIPTLIELARESGVELPSYSEEGLLETVFKESYQSLDEYLTGFGLTTEVMRTREQLERIAYELAVDNQQEGVRYIEVRFAPQLHTSKHLDTMDVLRAVCAGLERAKREFNSRPQVSGGREPPFEYGIIACALRYFNKHFSTFHNSFLALHRYTPPERVYALASLELAQAAAHARREEGLPVVGFDLAGPEEGYPPHHHREAYEYAHRHFLQKTVHAGEAYGPESIFKAITELHADRIGHGTSLLNPMAISDPDITDKARYVADLTQFIADRRITLEVCLTSNQQTNPAYRRLSGHPFGQMMERKLSVTLCTDNRTVSRTTVTDEFAKACTTFDLQLPDLKNLVVYGFKRSFYPHDYAAKRQYVRRAMEYFEKVVEEFTRRRPDLDPS